MYIFPSQSKRYAIHHNPRNPLQVVWCHFEIIPDLVNDLIEFDPSQDEEVLALIEIWRRIVKMPKPGNEMYCIVMLILYMLERRVQFAYVDFPFEGIERYISEHIHDKLTTSSMAAFFGYARSYFSRKFKSVYDLSPGEYLKTIRMSRAANMLTYGINIAQICATLGYADKKVFSRAFKTYHGISPSEYLKRHKLQP